MSGPPRHVRARGSIPGQAVRFVLVGAAGTALYVGGFWVLDVIMGSQVANVISWTVATVIGNLWHRRFTYGVTGEHLRRTDNAITFGTALAELAVSSLLLAVGPTTTSLQRSAMVVVGTMIGGTLRFVLNHLWFTR